MSKTKNMSIQDSLTVSKQCASALLDAWCRSDAAQMGELEALEDTNAF